MIPQDIAKIYKKLFKEKGVNVKKFEIEQGDDYSIMTIRLHGKVTYYVHWKKNINILTYKRIAKNEENPQEAEIINPDASKLVDAIANDYKTFIKGKTFIKQMISKIMEDSFKD